MDHYKNIDRGREEDKEFIDQVILIRRVTKVVKGGKNMRFSALVAVGNKKGMIGIGKGKAREVPEAIRKAIEQAKRRMITVPIMHETIPHYIEGKHDAGHVVLRPANKGTGVIAGGAVRIILELAGVQNILTKNIGSRNAITSARAAIEGLRRLKSPASVERMRDKGLKE